MSVYCSWRSNDEVLGNISNCRGDPVDDQSHNRPVLEQWLSACSECVREKSSEITLLMYLSPYIALVSAQPPRTLACSRRGEGFTFIISPNPCDTFPSVPSTGKEQYPGNSPRTGRYNTAELVEPLAPISSHLSADAELIGIDNAELAEFSYDYVAHKCGVPFASTQTTMGQEESEGSRTPDEREGDDEAGCVIIII